MPEINEPHSHSNRINCPECGGDVCTLRDTKRRWTHRSRVLPRMVWAALCLGLIGYWVSIGHLQFIQNQIQSLRVPRLASARVFTSLNPSGRLDVDATYVSTQEFRDAIEGDSNALGRVREKIAEANQLTQDSNSTARIQSVQFGWKEPYGSFTSNRSYHFGGVLWNTHHSVKLKDIRDMSLVGHDQYRWSWGDGGMSFFPQMGKKTISQNGAVIDSWGVNIVNVFRLCSVILVCAWLIGFASKRLHIPVVRNKYFGVTLMLALLSAAMMFSATNPREYN